MLLRTYRTLLALFMAGSLAMVTGCQETGDYDGQRPAVEGETEGPTQPPPIEQFPADQPTEDEQSAPQDE